jgi:hypothetical protein
MLTYQPPSCISTRSSRPQTCENFLYSFKAGLRPTRALALRCVRSSLRSGPRAPRARARARMSVEEGVLTVVLHSPPVDGGKRSLDRVEIATRMLRADRSIVVNLLDVRTTSVLDPNVSDASHDQWLASRPAMAAALESANAVLLAYGVSKPIGEGRRMFDDQVNWLQGEIAARGLPTWTVGGRPHHPSRWQRYTARAYPGVEFRSALSRSLVHAALEVGSPS